jgi:hypothetical protein
MAAKEGAFLSLQLLDTDKKVLSENLYWVADSKGEYSGLQKMKTDELTATARFVKAGQVEVTLTNKQNSVISFFNRVSLIDATTKERVLPAFYDNNYISILPGEQRKVLIDYPAVTKSNLAVDIDAWNGTKGKIISIAK